MAQQSPFADWELFETSAKPDDGFGIAELKDKIVEVAQKSAATQAAQSMANEKVSQDPNKVDRNNADKSDGGCCVLM